LSHDHRVNLFTVTPLQEKLPLCPEEFKIKRFELFRQQGLAVVIPLHPVTFQFTQHVQLVLSFNAFGDDLLV